MVERNLVSLDDEVGAGNKDDRVAEIHHADEVVEIHQTAYILATSSRADGRTLVLKEGETFAVFDRFGDVQHVGLAEQGMYVQGTRVLSRLELRVGRRRPHLLSSSVREDNDVLAVDLTNPDLVVDGTLVLPRGELHLRRSKCLWEGCCSERIVVSNFSSSAVITDLALSFDADFADIFEVRGTRRARRGRRRPNVVDADSVEMSYEGLDGRLRRTCISFDPAPTELLPGSAHFRLHLEPHVRTTIEIRTQADFGGPRVTARSFEETEKALRERIARLHEESCDIRTSNVSVNRWLARSRADLNMMITDTPHGPFPYAGVPWFSAPFGRDSILTALSCLWLHPDVAAGVLRFLAATQATEENDAQDAQPGKIIHEMRGGEMAALGEVPFGRYYGSVDATPLFLVLAGEYFRRTADLGLIEEIWPNLLAALRWTAEYGDTDGDGFLEYARQSVNGLVQQGWKDSHDSIFHADGHLARGPIALCEVQAYFYLALLSMAELGDARHEDDFAARLRAQARTLREKFHERFWCDQLGTFVLALDGEKKPCRVRASNAGHALWAGLPDEAQARSIVTRLMAPDSFSGWGVRTVAEGEARYNPMSYHNGSVWPHDNAVIGRGLARYGYRTEVAVLFESMLRASTFFDHHRMPELFCGFASRSGEGPTLYPVACAPQAWAAASPYLLLSSCLGMSVTGGDDTVSFIRSQLPPSITELRIDGLRVSANSCVDLRIERHQHDVGLTLLRSEGPVRMMRG
ncbi:MAG: glycogen debranching N-terminal domain-containing protein [Candidatus Binatia bacterium]